MNLKFIGELKELEYGIQIFSREYCFDITDNGIPVKIEKTSGNIEIVFEENRGTIKYNKKVHFFRALGLFLETLAQQDHFVISEEPQFTMNGAMFDSSRGAVMTTESVNRMILLMAAMGLNVLMLYTEDTYTIEDEPYFGYMRGRYSYQELKECDEYANNFGIEIIPCIQTLGHLEQFLKWPAVEYLKDTQGVLLAGEEKTYEFIEKMIVSATAPFTSKRIHIGMDEACELGMGRYLQKNGYHNKFEIMNNHLKIVLAMTAKYNLKPMIWSDTYFRLGSKTGEYYDLESVIPEDIVQNIPKDVQLVYWDYFHHEEDFYQKFIDKHKALGFMPVFAGGIWTWLGTCTNYGKTLLTTNPALSACKKEGVKEVMATIWGDDGGENNIFSNLVELQLYAEHGYAKELDMEKLKRRVKFCTGISFEAFTDLRFLDETPGAVKDNIDCSNPSKYLLWQDVLIGLFDKHIESLDMSEHYAHLEEKIREHRYQNKKLDLVFEVPEKLCSVLRLKSDMGIRIKQAYDNRDFDNLRQIVQQQLPDLSIRIDELRNAHREQWFKTYKPFGWEVLDIRYGGLLSRVDTAMRRITDFLDGSVDKIEELEEERLYFDGLKRPKEGVGIGTCNIYKRIVTANACF